MVEGKRCLRVVTHIEVQLRTYLTLDARLDLLVEVEDVIVSRAYSKRRVRDILVLEAEEQLRASLHLQLYTARAEHFIRRTDVKLHIGDVEFLLVIMLHFADLLLPVFMHDLPLRKVVILLLRQHIRRRDIRVTHLRTDDIRARLGLVLNGGGDIIRILQIQRTRRLVQLPVVLRSQLLYVRRCPVTAVRLRHKIRRLFGCHFAGLYLLFAFFFGRFACSFLRLCFRFLLLFSLLLCFLAGFLFRHQFLQRLRPRRLRMNAPGYHRQPKNQTNQ